MPVNAWEQPAGLLQSHPVQSTPGHVHWGRPRALGRKGVTGCGLVFSPPGARFLLTESQPTLEVVFTEK